jgi:transposase
MERKFLEECLASGMSLEAIGKYAGRHPSTVSYWLKKHGLSAAAKERHAPKGEIDQARLRVLVEEGASIRRIAAEFGAGYSTIRYWLRRLGLQTDRGVRRRRGKTVGRARLRTVKLRCPKHGLTGFYARPDGGFRCGRCSSIAVSERRRNVKRLLVSEAGGKCRICGFAEHPAALQFHHLDPTTKEFNLGLQGLTRSIDRMRSEAEKCLLLCANCHALVEAGVLEVSAADR